LDLFKDSSQNALHGNKIVYYANKKIAEKFRNHKNTLFGPSQKFDGAGRLTDPVIQMDALNHQ